MQASSWAPISAALAGRASGSVSSIEQITSSSLRSSPSTFADGFLNRPIGSSPVSSSYNITPSEKRSAR
ncbi:MAG: hypothetical protein H6Q89_2398 [Myxococcaceae bacterium]|nr:hypothetical protein [Myxococcaceae bacterium]